MSVFRFRVFWEDDDLIYRDIEVASGQTFQQFGDAILKSFDFDTKHASSFFESNDRWTRGREISSEVMSNKKDAPALSQIKTPVSALIATPSQKFIFEYDRAKSFTFLAELIDIEKEENSKKTYPHCPRKEGISPVQYPITSGADANAGPEKASIIDVEERYDLGADEMAEGFGAESEGGGHESFGGGSDAGSDAYDE